MTEVSEDMLMEALQELLGEVKRRQSGLGAMLPPAPLKVMTELQGRLLRRKPYTRHRLPGRQKSHWKHAKKMKREERRKAWKRQKPLLQQDMWEFYHHKRGKQWQISREEWEMYIQEKWEEAKSRETGSHKLNVSKGTSPATLANVCIWLGNKRNKKEIVYVGEAYTGDVESKGERRQRRKRTKIERQLIRRKRKGMYIMPEQRAKKKPN